MSKIAAAEAWLAIVIAVLVLIGWQFNVESLKRVVPSMSAMNPLVAVCLIASAVALLLARTYPVPRLRRWETQLLSCGVLLMGLAIIVRYGLHLPFLADRVLFNSKLDVPGQLQNAMAPNSAISLVLIGLSLLLIDAPYRLARLLGQYLALTTAFISLITLLGYAYGNPDLLSFKAFIPIAIHAAVCFILLSTAILLARPEEGVMRLFSSERGAGYLMRRLIVPAILLPAVLGWLRIQGQKAHLYNTEIGVALTIAANILLGCILVWIAGTILDKKEGEIEHTKDDFLNLATHQLLTPVTSMKMALSMLDDGTFGTINDAQARLVKNSLAASEQEIRLVKDLLNVAKADAGRMLLRKEFTDIGKLVQGVVQLQKPIIDSRQQHISVTAPSLQAPVDTERLKLAIDNLVSNASKYTPEGGKLTVTVKRAGNKALIEVADNGVGIAPEDIPKIFAKFTRLDNPLSKGRGGTGLGAYLVKQIIELHGGKVMAVSEPGKGSRFTIELPLGDSNRTKHGTRKEG